MSFCDSFAALFLSLSILALAGEFKPLFDGATLDGWEVKGGTATY